VPTAEVNLAVNDMRSIIMYNNQEKILNAGAIACFILLTWRDCVRTQDISILTT
jgi:hypothetical protein